MGRDLGEGPGGDDVAGHDGGEELALLLGAPGAGQRGGHDAAREQRAGRDVRAEGVGHEARGRPPRSR